MKNEIISQEVTITPSKTLTFKYCGKLNAEHKEELNVYNATDNVIAFKLKGTSPQHVKMFPGYGYLKPKGNVTIWVIAKGELLAGEHITVLLAPTPRDPPMDPQQFWNVPLTKPEKPFRRKIQLKFAELQEPLPKQGDCSTSWVDSIKKLSDDDDSECGSTSSEKSEKSKDHKDGEEIETKSQNHEEEEQN